MDVSRFKKTPVMGIWRGVGVDAVEPLVEAVLRSGLETIEITMNSKDAPEIIRRAKEFAGSRLMVGAGTVLNMESLKLAIDSGATFIVTPVLINEVMEYCARNIIPVFPGALTPQEIYNAWNAGATMVKIFPSNVVGPEYFKEVKAPFDKIELMACGGVTSENIQRYFSCGASAVAFGSSIFRKEWILKKDFECIGKAIKRLMSQVSGDGDKYSYQRGAVMDKGPAR